MSVEEYINHLRIRIANWEAQNKELSAMPFDEPYQSIYENEIRIKVIEEELEFLGGK